MKKTYQKPFLAKRGTLSQNAAQKNLSPAAD